MREKSRNHVSLSVTSLTNLKTGNVQVTKGESVQKVGVRVPDIVRNEPDSTGWRKPSPYSATPIQGGASLYAPMYTTHTHFSYGKPSFFSEAHGGIRGGWSSYGQERNFITLPNLPSSPPRNMVARAVNIALTQVANRQGNILETVVELKNTFQGLTRNARSLIAFEQAVVSSVGSLSVKPLQKHFGLPRKHRALKEWQRKLNGGVALTSALGSAWLTFWFGLAPIVSDMVLFMRILGDANLFNLRIKGTGRSVEKSSVSGRISPVTSPYISGGKSTFQVRYTVKRELGFYVSLYYTLNRNKVEEMVRKATTLGATDVATTAWAVIPYSWLIDFAVPVTQYLRAWEGTHGLDFKGGTNTFYCSYKEPKASFERHSDEFTGEIGRPYIMEPNEFRREVYKNAPLPMLYVRDPLNVWNAVTAFSLLVSRFTPYFDVKTSPRS